MSDNVMLGVVAVLLGLVLWFVVSHVTGIGRELTSKIDGFNPDHFQFGDDFKQELYDIMQMALEDTVGQMNIPTAKDHIVGGVMSLLQSRFGGLDPRSLIKDAISSHGYGEPQEDQIEETS
tara:strand:- start:2123 stop:2485 length:363 start_codon:yes stop_codon:yes gene_type:complete